MTAPSSLDSVDRMVQAWRERDPTLDVSALEVVGRVLLCAAHLERQLVQALKPLGLSFSDFDVLNTLRRRDDPGGTHPGRLARSSLITTGAMTSRLTRLEREGLVARDSDPRDGRAVRVRLTAQGEELAERALQVVLAVDERFLEPLDRHDRDAVGAALKRLLVRWEPPYEPGP